MERYWSPGGGVLLYPPLSMIPGDDHDPMISSFMGVPGARCSAGSTGTGWALTGRSGSLHETCCRTSPAGPQGGSGRGRDSIRPVGFRAVAIAR